MHGSSLLGDMSWQNVVDADGVGIAITGMSIVFMALVMVSVFITLLPRLLGALERIVPEVGERHAPAADSAGALSDETIAVAIGVALRARQKAHRSP